MDVGLDAALIRLAQEVRARLPAPLYPEVPGELASEHKLSVFVQLQIADQKGELELALERATRMTSWEYELHADPALRYDPSEDRFVEENQA